MHVLLIHQAFVSPSEGGGTRHYELGRHLIAAGHRFTIIASGISYLSGQATGRATEEYDGIRVHRVYTHASLHRSFVWRVVAFLSFMVSSAWAAWRVPDVDVVLGTTPPIFQAVSACLVAAVRRRPFVLEVRDLWPEFAIGMGVLTNPILIRLARLVERVLYARADVLLVNSPAYRDYLLGKGIAPSRIQVITNGVDAAMFDPAARGEARRAGHDAAAFIVTYAGALGQANDIDTLLEAAARLRDRTDIVFWLIGDGKERPRLEARAAGLGQVRFLGVQPKQAMREWLAASDACVAILKDIPEFRTTYPNKVFDYMAAGRPTILAIDGVIAEVVRAADGGLLVPPGDAVALAEAVRTLADDRERARALGRRARAHVVEHFDRSRQGRAFVSLMEGFAARR